MHGDTDWLRPVHLVQRLSRNQRKTAISLDPSSPSQRQRLGRRYSDAHTGKAARPAIDEDFIGSSPMRKLRNGRNQLLCMAASYLGIVRSNQGPIFEQGNGTGDCGCIDREKARTHQLVRSGC